MRTGSRASICVYGKQTLEAFEVVCIAVGRYCLGLGIEPDLDLMTQVVRLFNSSHVTEASLLRALGPRTIH